MAVKNMNGNSEANTLGGGAAGKKEEAVYTVAELANASRQIFGRQVMPECVVAAFKLEGKEKATKAEVVKIVERFLKREVK